MYSQYLQVNRDKGNNLTGDGVGCLWQHHNKSEPTVVTCDTSWDTGSVDSDGEESVPIWHRSVMVNNNVSEPCRAAGTTPYERTLTDFTGR